MATIGSAWFRTADRGSRIRRVASRPSISGIWTSIRTRSYGLRLERARRPRRRSTTASARKPELRRACPARPAGSWRCPRPAGCASPPAGRRRSRARRGGVERARAHRPRSAPAPAITDGQAVEEIRLSDGLDQIGGEAQLLHAAPRSRAGRRARSSGPGAMARGSVRLDRSGPGPRRPSPASACRGSRRRTDRRRRGRRGAPASAGRAVGGLVGPHAPGVELDPEDFPVGGVVVDDEDANAGDVRGQRDGRLPVAPACRSAR